MVLEDKLEREEVPNISGAGQPVAMGRGGVLVDTKIIPYSQKPNISASNTQPFVGRGSLPKYMKIINYEKPNISGSNTQPALGRGGLHKCIRIVDSKMKLNNTITQEKLQYLLEQQEAKFEHALYDDGSHLYQIIYRDGKNLLNSFLWEFYTCYSNKKGIAVLSIIEKVNLDNYSRHIYDYNTRRLEIMLADENKDLLPEEFKILLRFCKINKDKFK